MQLRCVGLPRACAGSNACCFDQQSSRRFCMANNFDILYKNPYTAHIYTYWFVCHCYLFVTVAAMAPVADYINSFPLFLSLVLQMSPVKVARYQLPVLVFCGFGAACGLTILAHGRWYMKALVGAAFITFLWGISPVSTTRGRQLRWTPGQRDSELDWEGTYPPTLAFRHRKDGMP